MWECGLKLSDPGTWFTVRPSLLMWECGLKHTRPGSNNARPEVTPYVGVWIETSYNSLILSYDLKSLLMWECGLKL